VRYVVAGTWHLREVHVEPGRFEIMLVGVEPLVVGIVKVIIQGEPFNFLQIQLWPIVEFIPLFFSTDRDASAQNQAGNSVINYRAVNRVVAGQLLRNLPTVPA
jgi:hypothetical protein